jgi:predicted nucleic acid-binding protein
MRYLLDSDSISDLLNPDSPSHFRIARRLSALRDSDRIALSILTLCEMEYGFANAPEVRKPALRQRISDAESEFEIQPLSIEAARLFGELKRKLRQVRQWNEKSGKLHNIDLMIAASALADRCVLVSADSLYGDLQQLQPSLRVENWSTAVSQEA